MAITTDELNKIIDIVLDYAEVGNGQIITCRQCIFGDAKNLDLISDKQEVKECVNCAYETLNDTVAPCCSCKEHSFWTPKQLTKEEER